MDAEGRFWLVGVEPGKVELRPQPHHTIASFSFRDQHETLEPAPGAVREHDLLLERERGTISGRVTRTDGTPVEGVPIGARNAQAGFSMTKASDAAGRYLL